MTEASVNNFDLIWDMNGHFFSTHKDHEANEGDEFIFRSGSRSIKAIVSELHNDLIVWEVISKEA